MGYQSDINEKLDHIGLLVRESNMSEHQKTIVQNYVDKITNGKYSS